MRINQPVTQQERTFSPDVKLISTTDLRGMIQHCNDDFVKISGFTRDELIGQPHVAESVNQQVVNIADLSTQSLHQADASTATTQQMQRIAHELHELVVRFKRQ